MRIKERIERLDPVDLTLLVTIPNQLLSLGLWLSYMIKGLIDVSTGYADAYYGYYFNAEVEASLAMDLAGAFFMTGALLSIALAISRKQSRFLLFAIGFFVAIMPCTQSITGNMSSIILCLFGYLYLRRTPALLGGMPRKKYIPTAMLLVFLADAVFAIIGMLEFLYMRFTSGPALDLGDYPEVFEGEEVPEWVTWGTGSGSPDFSLVNLAAPVLISLLPVAVAILIFLGFSGRGYRWYKLAAGMYFLNLILFIILLSPFVRAYEVFSALTTPEALLCIWMLVGFGRKTLPVPSGECESPSKSES